MAAPRFLSAWFCPFAQRAQIALEARGIPHTFVESLGWDFCAADGTWHHWKSEELLRHSSAGLVPTLVAPDGRASSESLVVCELADELAEEYGEFTSSPLLPACPWQRAQTRQIADWVNQKICSEYYTILVRRDAGERLSAFHRMRSSILSLTSSDRTNCTLFTGWDRGGSGPFFGGDNIGLIDCALAPHALRLYVLEEWRGPAFALPRNDPELDGWHTWLDAIRLHPAVRAATPERFEERYLQHSKKYADGAARSKVAEAVRAGRSAHDMDTSAA
jgi:glutathione S-transferase